MQEKTPLFRTQALNARRPTLEGRVAISTPSSMRWFAFAAFGVVVGIAALAVGGSYTRKQAAFGQIVTTGALARITVREPGTVIEVPLAEGATVNAGQVLVRLRRGLDAGDNSGIDLDRIAHMRESIATLTQQLVRDEEIAAAEGERLRVRRDSLTAQNAALARDLVVYREKLTISERQVDRLKGLADSGIIARSQYDNAAQELLSTQLQLQSAESRAEQLLHERAELDSQIAEHPTEAAKRRSTLQLQLADFQQQLREAEDRESYSITAPIGGVVASLQAKTGETVPAGALLMVVMPQQARFEAELFVPSRAIGFIQPGQPVSIRYQAFPYQRFGLHPGTVSAVSETIMAPREVITTVPLAAEPVYRVKIELPQQQVAAFGRTYALQPGMLIEADVELDRRPLWQWVLEPLLRIKGDL
jgi:membrane fusion protein